MTRVIRHERTDAWKVEIDGKVYWITRFVADGKANPLTIEVVRPSPNGQNPYCRVINDSGPTYKRIAKQFTELEEQRQ